MKNLSNPKVEPRYEHDCDECVFLGHHGKYDLYYCERSEITVIARFGPLGDYKSGLSFAKHGLIPELVEAYKRAQALGITPKPVALPPNTVVIQVSRGQVVNVYTPNQQAVLIVDCDREPGTETDPGWMSTDKPADMSVDMMRILERKLPDLAN
jgi:hypothetical protein